VLLGAPTAAGKTEAAILPLLSRMVSERWSGLSVLYVCPLRALLNNLYPRVSGYAELVGRSVGVWHGDVSQGARTAILRDPPDLLLTTPESLEAMFLSRRVDEEQLLGGVRAMVVDEIHVFGSDDRGWHMLAVLDRIDAMAKARAQRIGLTATVGNPQELLSWLSRRPALQRRSVMIDDNTGGAAPELTIDWVGSLKNAAQVITSLHQGEKRLVFCDSRAQVEELATMLRELGTSTFVSHSSLSRDERHQAEQAFAQATNCVIVATSTLELGIDVGDLDRVILIDSPPRVSSVLQRCGRTGRRLGARRNCLFLCISEEMLIQAVAITRLLHSGWVEPVAGPPLPLHLAAQQLLARVLSDGQVPDSTWPGPLGAVAQIAELDSELLLAVRKEMERVGVLVRDGPFVQIGPTGEDRYGRRNFMDVTSLFLTEPLISVHWGVRELGSVDPSVLTHHDGGHATILLGGRAWNVEEVDWRRRRAWVLPSKQAGRSHWVGSGVAISSAVARSIRTVLADTDEPAGLTVRARAQLARTRSSFSGLREGRTMLARESKPGRECWWTFAGGKANAALAVGLYDEGVQILFVDDLSIGIRGTLGLKGLKQTVKALRGNPPRSVAKVAALDGLKFGDCLPEALGLRVLQERSADDVAVMGALLEPVLASDR
jgi:ATP-dependent Lhr-like helicase